LTPKRVDNVTAYILYKLVSPCILSSVEQNLFTQSQQNKSKGTHDEKVRGEQHL
jgi:hypothetical protein